jgi:hypothetical protein
LPRSGSHVGLLGLCLSDKRQRERYPKIAAVGR